MVNAERSQNLNPSTSVIDVMETMLSFASHFNKKIGATCKMFCDDKMVICA